MAHETSVEKPLAGALRAARVLDCKIEDDELDHCTCDFEDGADCPACVQIATIIGRESGLTELVEAAERVAERADCGDHCSNSCLFCVLSAAARRVREGQ